MRRDGGRWSPGGAGDVSTRHSALGQPLPVPGPSWPPPGFLGQLATRPVFIGNAHCQQTQRCPSARSSTRARSAHPHGNAETRSGPLPIFSYCYL